MRAKPEKVTSHNLIARLVAGQDGVVSRRQLLGKGLSNPAISRWIQTGTLVPVHRGVYAVGYRRVGRRGLWHAALLAEGPQAAISHRDAGSEWKMTKPVRGPVSVTVPGASGREHRRGIDLHRAPLPPGEVVRRQGLRVTSPARTMLDLAALLTPRELERALDEAHFLGRVSSATLTETLDANGQRSGSAALRRALASHDLGSTRTDTALEERFLAIIRAAGLPDPRCQVWIGRFRVDFLWAAERLVAEADGEAAHRGQRRQARDADRDSELDARGYQTLRFSEDEIYDRPGAVVSRVAEALNDRAAPP